ncbi:uncharacterized protein PAC_05818 [Phialocephala subalpina]|uniref:Uncharacterized protein n=1 Tax=Phialocephala subalpina TaxID=576137 RepID=A0A1L7WT34_9HELO|nr:uncharacterized protein PAC_05818 [Phialocephala subalpina]
MPLITLGKIGPSMSRFRPLASAKDATAMHFRMNLTSLHAQQANRHPGFLEVDSGLQRWLFRPVDSTYMAFRIDQAFFRLSRGTSGIKAFLEPISTISYDFVSYNGDARAEQLDKQGLLCLLRDLDWNEATSVPSDKVEQAGNFLFSDYNGNFWQRRTTTICSLEDPFKNNDDDENINDGDEEEQSDFNDAFNDREDK